MNVLLIGSGGREHAIALKIKESKKLNKFYCIPGNPGIKEIAETVNIDSDDLDAIVDFAKEKKIDLLICGPEKPLVNGLADKCIKAGIAVFGPNKHAAQLEGSKVFAKKFMAKHNIPTADFRIFENYDEAIKFIEKHIIYPIVIKADGLAAGKGVKIAENKKVAKDTIKKFMIDKIFGDSGNTILIEDLLIGEEMSFFYITDSKKFIPLIPAKDYKKAYDNDEGENTGGMGSYAPHTSINENLKKQIDEEIVNRIKSGFKKDKINYRGVLYIGLMLTNDGPKVIEFNCRFGDPETQVIMPLLKNDILDLFYATALGKLDSINLKWENKYSACVVIASGGYPGNYKKGIKIEFESNPFNYIHAGTKYSNKNIVTNGGRVLNAVYTAPSKSSALEGAYKLAQKVKFEGAFYRKDIGK
jgi:phosphoribosylamine--glycine ligase